MTSPASTDFVRKNQQHIQQLMQQRHHEVSLAEAAVLAESRQRQKLREKVLSMREEKWSTSQQPDKAEVKSRNFDHSDTMPNQHSSPANVASPLRRCLSAAINIKQVTGPISAYPACTIVTLLHPEFVATWHAATLQKTDCRRHHRFFGSHPCIFG